MENSKTLVYLLKIRIFSIIFSAWSYLGASKFILGGRIDIESV